MSVVDAGLRGEKADRPVPIGSRLELFIDDDLIDEMRGVVQELHSPIPREVSVGVDKPWESPHIGYATVFQDGDLFRMYYRAMNASTTDVWPSSTAYAESRDGIVWEKPALGVIDFRGSIATNVVWSEGQTTNPSAGNVLCPFKDGNPAAPPEQRYKALTPWKGYPNALFSLVSPDGLRWRKMRDEPTITGFPPSEMTNHPFWDTRLGRYAAYVRLWTREGHMKGVRSAVRTLSEDFLHWSEPEWVTFGQAPEEHLYTFPPVQYSRAPHIYLSLCKRYVPPPEGVSEYAEGFLLTSGRKWPACASRNTWVGWYGQDHGISDGVLACSRDGLRWKRYVEAFIRPGRDGQNWTDRNFMIASGVLQTAPDELSIYYIEHYLHTTARIRRASLRLDGFVSIRAKYPAGHMITRPLVFAGAELVINYATSAAGSVRVEVQDEQGRGIEGFQLDQCPEIYGDEIERVVSWSGGSHVGALAGRPVRLKFALQDADLYAMRFR